MTIVRRLVTTALHCGALVAICALAACDADIADGIDTRFNADAGTAGSSGQGGRAGSAAGNGAGRGGSAGTAGSAGRMASTSAGAGAGAGGSAMGGRGGSAGAAGRSGAGAGGAGAGAGGMGGAAGTMEEPPGVRFIGRTDRRQADVVRMAWSGSGILFRFSGSNAFVTLDDRAGFFTLLVDGMKQPTLTTSAGEREYQVARDLPDAMHTVELYRRTEASFGETRFLGVDVGDGELLSPPPRAARRIEIIGDSITCGYGNEGPNGDCPFEARTENHYLTYGAISARDLDAELVTLAWSGKGIIYNYGDDKNEPMPDLYPRAVPNDSQSPWDFSQWQPHVVVINLGTNDFSTDGDPPENEFGPAYTDLLAFLRDQYPEAFIVCLVPTGLGGADQSTAEDYMTRVVDDFGDDKVVVTALEFQSTGAGCSYHPSLATHASMAQSLTAELKRLLGW